MINLTKIKNQELYFNDCFDVFPIIPDKSVDGSGTTNLASLILNRKSIGIDNDKVSFDKAVKRLNDYLN
ncbi:site-specific DNA-methyltransferase [Candidatus Dojkabacteria bacterium]|jgi:hypothetical protein|nr:site-specific DNA-methyltransferase [Candidatus Dojkabacteria bacterium]